jgi:uncharacterized protein YqeY
MPSQLRTRIQADLAAARKGRDKERALVLSTLLAELRYAELRLEGTETAAVLEDDGVLQVISKAIKQRKDAAEQMRAGGREELAAKEDAQAEVLQAYLPRGLSEDEVRALVREIRDGGAVDMGRVMGQLMPRIRGRFDGKEANRIVREELAG